MTVRAIARRGRATRLFGWTLMAAVCGFLLWIVFGGAAHAEDPKAAARAIGNAGNSAARTIARDSTNAAEVPGYAGTNLPERNIGASRLEDEGRARLADPDDPGGAAGRAVVRGTTSRPRRPAGERSDGAALGEASRHRRSLRRTARTGSPRAARRTAGRTFRTRTTAGPAGPCATASAPAARR